MLLIAHRGNEPIAPKRGRRSQLPMSNNGGSHGGMGGVSFRLLKSASALNKRGGLQVPRAAIGRTLTIASFALFLAL